MSPGLAVVATGTAIATDRVRPAHNSPSFFADPAGWLVAAAVQDALAGCTEPVLADPDQVGVLVLSATGPARSMRDIAGTATRGMVSPLRFAGANPGVLAGLACIRWRLRGPSLNLAMAPADGVDVARTVVTAWLTGGQATWVLVAGHHDAGDQQIARCAVATLAGPHHTGLSLAAALVPLEAPDDR